MCQLCVSPCLPSVRASLCAAVLPFHRFVLQDRNIYGPNLLGMLANLVTLPLPCVSTASVAETLPLPCVSTASVSETLPLPCVSTASVAETLPLPCGPQVNLVLIATFPPPGDDSTSARRKRRD